jgi:hypothetical protein
MYALGEIFTDTDGDGSVQINLPDLPTLSC